MAPSVVVPLDPSLGGGVQQRQGQLGLSLEHGQEAPLDLAPEGLLLAVLLGRLWKGGVVDDAQSLEALPRLGRQHRGAVVRQQRPGQASLLDRLRQPVAERLCRLGEVPLQVAAQPGVVVEDPEQVH